MKPKVAIVLPYFGNGGAETMVSRLASSIDLTKVDAEVICIYGSPLNNRLENAVTANGIQIKFIGKGKGFSFSALRRLYKELSEYKPDAVHTHLSACVYCAPWILSHQAVMLHTIHSTPQFELIKPKQIVMRLMYNLKKAVPVAISHEIQNMMITYYKLGFSPELVYNPVDVSRYHIGRRDHAGINIVTVGRLSKEKNQLRLIKSVEKLSHKYKNLSLTILGEGTQRKEIEEYISTHNIGGFVRLMGNVDDVEEYFTEADVFALSSDYEGLPLVILEAMAAELPIISTDVGGIKDIVTDNGILVPLGDEASFESALEKVVSDANLRNQMGMKSFTNVGKYDSKAIAKEYVGLYIKYSKRG